jgi:hypothetical protein
MSKGNERWKDLAVIFLALAMILGICLILNSSYNSNDKCPSGYTCTKIESKIIEDCYNGIYANSINYSYQGEINQGRHIGLIWDNGTEIPRCEK